MRAGTYFLTESRICFVFFFSSRRRHTRYIGDWSSDVCSSDLKRMVMPSRGVEYTIVNGQIVYADGGATGTTRSEERRVGKECRSRWSWYHDKKKKSNKVDINEGNRQRIRSKSYCIDSAST